MKRESFIALVENLIITMACVWIAIAIIVFGYRFDLDRELAKLPASCSKEVEGWNIYQASLADIKKAYNNDTAFAYSFFTGMTIIPDDVIMLSSIDIEAKKALPHEIGHAADYNHGFPSETDEFYDIYKLEATGYGAANQFEFFAETYGKLVRNIPDEKTPLANEYVSNYISD